MANFTTCNDIRTEALKLANEDDTDTTGKYYTDFFVHLNRFYMDAWFSRPWRFARAWPPQAFAVVAPITSLTVSVTNASPSATLSASQTTDLVNRKILINGIPYRISAHGGSTDAITLDLAWQGTTDGTATCIIFQDEYDLSGLTRLAHVVYVRDSKDGRIVKRVAEDDHDILSQWADPTEGDPLKFTMLTDTRIMFATYPQDARRFEVTLHEYPADLAAGGTPDWPRWRRQILVDGTAAHILADKEDDKSSTYFTLAGQGLEQMFEEESWYNRLDHTPRDRNPYLSAR